MRRTIVASGLAVVGLLAAVPMSAAQAAPASTDGGCATTGPLRACIHAASDGTLIPDNYLETSLPGCVSLLIQVTNGDESTNYSSKVVSDCTSHKIGQPTTTGLHGNFHTVVTAFDGSSRVLADARSPEITG